MGSHLQARVLGAVRLVRAAISIVPSSRVEITVASPRGSTSVLQERTSAAAG